MIAYVTGKLLTHTDAGAIVLAGPVGYELIGEWLLRVAIGDTVTAWTYQYFENSNIPRLVACETVEGRELLMKLLTVSGVGPKSASRIVGTADVATITTAITSGDLSFFTAVKGLGKKTAQKIILELGKKLVDVGAGVHAPLYEALRSLAFTDAEIARAIKATPVDTLSEHDALGALLKALGRKS